MQGRGLLILAGILNRAFSAQFWNRSPRASALSCCWGGPLGLKGARAARPKPQNPNRKINPYGRITCGGRSMDKAPKPRAAGA